MQDHESGGTPGYQCRNRISWPAGVERDSRSDLTHVDQRNVRHRGVRCEGTGALSVV
jgi:hypothetical protein